EPGESPPLVVGPARDRDPPVLALARERAVRHRPRRAVARAAADGPVVLVVEQPGAQRVAARLDLRDVEVHAPPRPLPVQQAGGAKLSPTASAQWPTIRSAMSTPSGCLRLSVTLRFPTLSPSNIGAPSRPCGLSGPSAYTRRKSGRLRDSTRNTVAPCSTK